MQYKNIIFEKNEKVATVTINRPPVLNALNTEVILELLDCFNQIAVDSSILCVIITGGGEKSFVAGADIAELNKLDIETGQILCDRGHALCAKIENLPQPVIAAINGFALGGGCELAISCDIRLASDKAKIGQPEINLSILPGFGGTQRLPRLVGKGKATEMILTGDHISAEEAKRIGLVDQVYPHDELLPKAKELAQKIASKAPLAVIAAKKSINYGLNVDLKSGCEHEALLFAANCATEDKNEGTGAFLEKRKPVFKGK